MRRQCKFVGHKFAKAEHVKNICKKNSGGREREDVWGKFCIQTVAIYILLVWGVGKLP